MRDGQNCPSPTPSSKNSLIIRDGSRLIKRWTKSFHRWERIQIRWTLRAHICRKGRTTPACKFESLRGVVFRIAMPERLELLVQLSGGGQGHTTKEPGLPSRLLAIGTPFIGIILATVSSFCFSVCSVIVKWLENVHPMELAAFRYREALSVENRQLTGHLLQVPWSPPAHNPHPHLQSVECHSSGRETHPAPATMLRGHHGTHAEFLRLSTHEAGRSVRDHILDARVRGALCEALPERALWPFQYRHDILDPHGGHPDHTTTLALRCGCRGFGFAMGADRPEFISCCYRWP